MLADAAKRAEESGENEEDGEKEKMKCRVKAGIKYSKCDSIRETSARK